jgi:hypothetical protein
MAEMEGMTMPNPTPLTPIIYAKMLGNGNTPSPSGEVTPEAVLAAAEQMTSEQQSQFRAAIGATDASTSIPDNVKVALLNCFDHVAWTDDQGQTYVDALEAALYPLDHITAVYTQSGTVYDTDSLDSLKSDLVVTAVYEGGNTETVEAANYTLIGTLTDGTSTITVSYGGKTTTFDVTVSAGILFRKTDWTFTGGNLDTGVALCNTDVDFSVAMDVVTTTNPSSGDASQYRLIRIIDATGSSYALAVYKNHNTDTTLSFRFMSAISYDIGSSTPGRHRFVITHTQGSNSATIKYRKDDGTAQTVTLESAFVPSTRNLVLGQSSGVNMLPAGTLNDFIIYDHIMSAHAVDAFLGL